MTEEEKPKPTCRKCGREKTLAPRGVWDCNPCRNAWKKTDKGRKVKNRHQNNMRRNRRAKAILAGEITPKNTKGRAKLTLTAHLYSALNLLYRFDECWTQTSGGFFLEEDKLPELHSIREDARVLLDTTSTRKIT